MDNTPTALFTSHELDLTQLLQGVHQTLDTAQNQEGEARKKSLRRVEVELDGADDVVSRHFLANRTNATNRHMLCRYHN